MYYELYIDVFFLVNFMMDYLMLLIAKRILKCSATHGNICIGALIGSGLTCIGVCVPIPYAFVKFMWFHIIVNTLMIRAGLKVKFGKKFFKAFVVLYISGFLLGGVLEYLHQYVRMTSLLFGAAIAGYYIVLGIIRFLLGMIRKNQCRCKVDLYYREKMRTVEAIIDTGNGLHDPVSSDPVSILDKRELFSWGEDMTVSKVRFIPYHTIGKREGLLPVIRLDKMCVHSEEELWIEKPIVGISEEEISADGEYRMILNPDIF